MLGDRAMATAARAIRFAAALAGVVALSGCPSTPERDGEAPPPEPAVAEAPAPADAVQIQAEHAGLATVEKQAEEALGMAGEPDFAALARAAQAFEQGAQALPVSRADNGMRYNAEREELALRAAELRLAADAQDTLAARRAFHKLTASCVRCHVATREP